jgi:hypothetical protein
MSPDPLHPHRGVKTSLFDLRATGIAVLVVLLLVVLAIVWRMHAREGDQTKVTAVVNMEFGLRDPVVEDIRVLEPPRGYEREATKLEVASQLTLPEERPNVHMHTGSRVIDTPVYTEVIANPNPSVNTNPNADLAINPKDIAMAMKTDPTEITDAPEEVTVTADEVGWAVSPIAVEVAGPADFIKYNNPTPRDKPALYTFNQAPRPGRPIKLLPKAFGDQSAPSWGVPGPMNINLWGNSDVLRMMDRVGGGVRARTAVESCLHWLAVHQGPDGTWPAETLEGQSGASLACTALSTLAFMGGGNTIRKGEYRRNVLKGIDALIRAQKPDGHITQQGANLYTHAICTIALCESYGRARDERIGLAAQKSIDFAVKAVGADGGWRYTPNVDKSDMSVTAWFIQAMKTAKLAALKFEPQATWARSLVYVDSVTDQGASKDSNGAVTYQFQEGQSYANGHPALTAAGMMVRQISGTMGVRNHILIKGAELTKARPPSWKDKDFYYWYYATYAMHNMGSEHRIWWNQKIRDVLLENQSREGDNAGSWDPTGDKWGTRGGRTYVTALGALCLEVYYRYSEALNSFGTAPELDELFLE